MTSEIDKKDIIEVLKGFAVWNTFSYLY
jgi:hypothetical protein